MRPATWAALWITLAAVAVALTVLGGFALAGWPGEPNGCLETFGCFCEAPRPVLVRQPANTFSNVGFIAAGLAIAVEAGRRRRRLDLALLALRARASREGRSREGRSYLS
jgi:hypothetical protein